MINRGNWKQVKAYLQYRLEIHQISKSSLRLEEDWLRHLLEWMESKPFHLAPKVRPAFPEYILTARLDGKKEQLSPVYIKKVVRAAYRFFQWLVTHRPGYKAITQAWLDTLKPVRMTIEPAEHEAVTLEEITAIAQAPVFTMRDRRIRAAAVFWYLSAIRIGAFVSLPLSAVDLDNLEVKQWPKLGVLTKSKKHATTYLLNIPDLLKVVREWDREVRQVCGNDGLWFAHISPITGEIEPGLIKAGEHRQGRARDDLEEWLQKVGLPYHSPHKFRHGFARLGIKRAKDIQGLKAVSQNLMHSNLSITDGVYGILSDLDVRNQIASLGLGVVPGSQDASSIIPLLESLLSQLKSKTLQ